MRHRQAVLPNPLHQTRKSLQNIVADNNILAAVLTLHEQHPKLSVILVSKDINLRIKASISGLIAEDYENDRALDDFSLLFSGVSALPEDFWKKHHQDLRSWNDKGCTYCEIALQKEEEWYPNQDLYLPGEENIELRVLQVLDNRKVTLKLVNDFRND